MLNIAGRCQQTFENKKFVGITQQCFALLPQLNFPANNLNFHWRWRWWDQFQAIFLNLFYFIKFHLDCGKQMKSNFKLDNDKKQKKSGCGFWCIHENCILIVQYPKVKPLFAKFQWKIVIENNPLWIIIKDDVDANCLFQSPLAFWWCSSARHMWWQNYTICKLFNSFFRSFQKKPCYY